ncbi:siderophore-iron transporter Str3 [Schizosaccharomyces cryophilus OY26]|uniref:Siderophore-iron transporter Str3 n=1 Tax=Schizosaccharomyces cryophilus (strain OY26 / ATCC MYA-4695 / CBS 11777 / NBRC 106824 / NRRL Y48691) TaxID=653667 RepID=S9W305_SCHCR|nr:siderophore-iron transporter Str3 [Schizosaccharomyces cryophilus OY26]EPY52325.1 siderophore-iron transporter Str3 [Schizosaccharomyces cryophilus OY26]
MKQSSETEDPLRKGKEIETEKFPLNSVTLLAQGYKDDKETYFQKRGVIKIEETRKYINRSKKGKLLAYTFGFSILVCAWAYAIQSSTTSSYQVYATSSFNRQSLVSTLEIATSVISAVCKPILGKISDVTSRPLTYAFVLMLYAIGFTVIASSKTISAYVIGTVFVAIGGSGLDFLNSVIVGDLTPLKWRGFATSILSTPFIFTVWFSGLIVQGILDHNWRWGYGMFAIIMPVVLVPAIVILSYLERSAVAEFKSKKEECPTENITKSSKLRNVYQALLEVDVFGLILLGFGFSLLLLPFSLVSYAKNGWRNPSMIAMIIVGGIILIIFGLYELFLAPYPLCPRRILFNKTFMMAVVIDFFYYFGGYIQSLYQNTYIWIIKDWSYRDLSYFSNIMTVALCLFGLLAGVIHRSTHRYKFLQIIGLAIKIVGYAILVRPGRATTNTVSLAFSEALIGLGGSFSVVGTSVASQASVPHQDLATVISTLNLWTQIGGAIGSAIAAPIYSSKVPKYLREYMPSNVTQANITSFYSNTDLIREYPMNSDIRQGAINAYSKSMFYLYAPALGISFISFIAAFFQTNYFLGNQQNAVEDSEEPDERRRDHKIEQLLV